MASRYGPSVLPSGQSPLADALGEFMGGVQRAGARRREDEDRQRADDREDLALDIQLGEMGGGRGAAPTSTRMVGAPAPRGEKFQLDPLERPTPQQPDGDVGSPIANALGAYLQGRAEPEVLALPGEFVPELGTVTRKALMSHVPAAPQFDTSAFEKPFEVEEQDPRYMNVGSGRTAGHILRPEVRAEQEQRGRLQGIGDEMRLRGGIEREFEQEERNELADALAHLSQFRDGGVPEAVRGGVPLDVASPDPWGRSLDEIEADELEREEGKLKLGVRYREPFRFSTTGATSFDEHVERLGRLPKDANDGTGPSPTSVFTRQAMFAQKYMDELADLEEALRTGPQDPARRERDGWLTEPAYNDAVSRLNERYGFASPADARRAIFQSQIEDALGGGDQGGDAAEGVTAPVRGPDSGGSRGQRGGSPPQPAAAPEPAAQDTVAPEHRREVANLLKSFAGQKPADVLRQAGYTPAQIRALGY